MIPGNGGGSNWGGVAWDAGRQVAVANAMHFPFLVALIPRDDFESVRDSGQYPDTEFSPQLDTPYGMRRKPLLSSWEMPCVAPPCRSVSIGACRAWAAHWSRPAAWCSSAP
jgi:quinoprotein glucose dehydrogenase